MRGRSLRVPVAVVVKRLPSRSVLRKESVADGLRKATDGGGS